MAYGAAERLEHVAGPDQVVHIAYPTALRALCATPRDAMEWAAATAPTCPSCVAIIGPYLVQFPGSTPES